MVEGAALEKQYAGQLVSRVRIPPSPPNKSRPFWAFFVCLRCGFERVCPEWHTPALLEIDRQKRIPSRISALNGGFREPASPRVAAQPRRASGLAKCHRHFSPLRHVRSASNQTRKVANKWRLFCLVL